MRAMVCIGKPDKQLLKDLKHTLFLKALFNMSLRLHSVIWKYNKTLESIGETIPLGNYKTLKKFNFLFSKLQNTLSRLQIAFSLLNNTIKERQDEFITHSNLNLPHVANIEASFKEELEKSDDREVILKQMNLNLSGLRDQVQQRSTLIMTKSNQRLNLILLVLTVISVTSVGQILGFSLKMIVLGSIVVIPFVFFTIKNYLQYRKNFEDDK